MSGGPLYMEAADPARLAAEYPQGRAFLDRFVGMSRDELRALQERRFERALGFAWKVPFYQRLWGQRGIQPGDIRRLDDLPKLPTYGKAEIMASVERAPPLGDFHGLESWPAGERPPVVLQTTSGTTGRPQPLLFGARSREVQNLLLARLYHLQGLREDDVVHSVYGHGMINGGHYVREAVLHWTRALFLSAGTGVETRSATQVELMRDFGATVLVGFGDYLKRLAEVAREAGIVPGEQIRIRMISGHLGAESREAMHAAWGGAEVFDWYGVGDTGAIAGEGPDHDGLHLLEDAQYVELIDPDTKAVQPDRGNICCTCLFKDDVFPIIRFDTNDLTELMPGDSALGLPFRRVRGFLGRSDNMVKLRGINVYPTGIGAILTEERQDVTGEYLCRVDRRGERDEMTVLVEVRDGGGLEDVFRRLLRRRLGVDVQVEIHPPGALSPLTGIESRQKPIRLIDRRKG